MQIDSLKYFYDVATMKSISKVAQESHISQPALSQQLLKLEKKLGVTLLNRSNKGVELTKEGEILLKYSEEILLAYDHLIDELRNWEKEDNLINVESESISANHLLGKAVSEIIKTFKSYELNLYHNCNGESKINLIHNKVQIIVGNEKIEEENLISTYVGSDNIVGVVGKQFIGEVTSNTPIVSFKDSLLDRCGNKSQRNKVLVTSTSLPTIKEVLKSNACLAYLPKICVQDELERGTLRIIENNVLEYPFYLTYKKDIKRPVKSKINVISTKLQYILKAR